MDPAPVICSVCGTPNDPAAKFCNTCGSPMSVTCGVCGTVNPGGARFCNQCGNSLGADAAPSRPAAPAAVAERRLVSVLFADLVGFTTWAEGRDAEETREMLSRYFDLARAAIERHGGTVEKFIGDAVMAVWGAPVAHEDDAERAVRAALELVAAVPSLGDEATPIQARAGVLTGEAAVTIGAEAQGMVAGDLVNTASRLQSAAAPGTVLVGEATMRAATTSISFEPAGEQALKGKAAPVPAWRAIAVVARRGGSGRTEILEPPFVGREDELQLLKDLFEATGRERKARLVSVIGQAGIGKSRLAWEFEKYLDGVVDTAYWHEGRSPSYGEGISYWALVEMVRRRAGIGEGDEPATVRARLNEVLEQFVPDPSERRWLGPRVAGLLGVEELPVESREELFAAWRTFFQRLAGQAPVIMVFTDLQWADQGMLDFIESLLTWARNDPIFVVALARPELLERRPEWGSAARSATRLNLEPLSDEQIGQMLEGLVPGIPPVALRSIVERAEGIPLYAVETVRMLLDRELIVPDDGRFVLTREIGSLGVAETLHALIASRLDALLPEDRGLVQDASVLGQSFSLDALAAVSGRDQAALAQPLERLARRQLLEAITDPRSPERGLYHFVQAVVQEIAYASLARPDRRARHLAAARYVEGLGDEEASGVLASHYFAAHQASRPGPEADALAAQARLALVAAADRAAALHSHRRALGYLEQAITITTDPAERAALLVRASESGESTSDFAAAAESARAARDLYRELGDLPGVLRAATWLGRQLISDKLEPQAITVLEDALAEAASIEDCPEHASALAELSRVYMMVGRSEESIATADKALELAGHHRLVRPAVEALINKGTSLLNLGRSTEAAALLRGAAAQAELHGLAFGALRARNNLLGAVQGDDAAAAMVLAEEGYQLSLRMGNRTFLLQFAMMAAYGSLRTGDWDAWIDAMAAAEEGETMPPFYVSSFAAVRGTAAALRGDRERADAELAAAAEVAGWMDSQMVNATVAVCEAQVALYAGDWRRASERALVAGQDNNYSVEGPALAVVAATMGGLTDDLGRALAMLHSSTYQGRRTTASIALAEGGLALRAGRWDEARAAYRRALEVQSAASDLLAEAVTGLVWGTLAGAHDPEAAQALEAGERFFAERGAPAVPAAMRAAAVPVDAVAVP